MFCPPGVQRLSTSSIVNFHIYIQLPRVKKRSHYYPVGKLIGQPNSELDRFWTPPKPPHISACSTPISTRPAAFEREDRGLSNAAGLVEIGVDHVEIWSVLARTPNLSNSELVVQLNFPQDSSDFASLPPCRKISEKIQSQGNAKTMRNSTPLVEIWRLVRFLFLHLVTTLADESSPKNVITLFLKQM